MKTLTNQLNHTALLEETIKELSQDKQELSMMCEEKDTELERVKTTLQALKEKLVIFDDLEQELQMKNEQFMKSEQIRAQLQQSIEETAKKISEDA